MSMFAFGHQLAIAVAEPDLRFPTDGLEGWGELFQSQWEIPTDLGRIPVGPSAFAQGTPRLGIPGRGKAALLTTRPPRIF
jgi:hypothetical protein